MRESIIVGRILLLPEMQEGAGRREAEKEQGFVRELQAKLVQSKQERWMLGLQGFTSGAQARLFQSIAGRSLLSMATVVFLLPVLG